MEAKKKLQKLAESYDKFQKASKLQKSIARKNSKNRKLVHKFENKDLEIVKKRKAMANKTDFEIFERERKLKHLIKKSKPKKLNKIEGDLNRLTSLNPSIEKRRKENLKRIELSKKGDISRFDKKSGETFGDRHARAIPTWREGL